jgi:hypothetical protein
MQSPKHRCRHLSPRQSCCDRQGRPVGDGYAQRRALRRSAPRAFDSTRRALWPSEDFDVLVQAFKTHGFRPVSAWYLNGDVNIAHASRAPEWRQAVAAGAVRQRQLGCDLHHPRNRQAIRCAPLARTDGDEPAAGHWLPLERKAEHIQAIRTWLRDREL